MLREIPVPDGHSCGGQTWRRISDRPLTTVTDDAPARAGQAGWALRLLFILAASGTTVLILLPTIGAAARVVS